MRKEKELKIVDTIPHRANIFMAQARFVVFDDGTLGELRIRDLENGRIAIRARIKNLPRSIRRYLYHILSRYTETRLKLDSLIVKHYGLIQIINIEKEKISHLLNQIKPETTTKEIIEIYNKVYQSVTKIQNALSQIKKRKLKISLWAMRMGKILIEEKKRISDIIYYTTLQLARLYKQLELKQKIDLEIFSPHATYNLLNGLDNIKVHFSENEDDLKKIRQVLRKMEKIYQNKERENSKLKEDIFWMIKTLTPFIDREVEIRIGKKILILKEGKIWER